MGSSIKPIDLRNYTKKERFFSGAGRGELLTQLQQKIQSPELKICVVSGPDGIGKTALLAELLHNMRPVTRVVSFSGHYGSIEAVLEHIGESLNLTLDPEHSVAQQRDYIGKHLAFNYQDKPLLVLFDDAHALPLPVIRDLLAVLSAPGSSSSVLFVDNEAADVVCNFLHQQSLDTLNVRRIYREELAAYLSHHYHHAVSFTELEQDAIFVASDGVPLRINQQAEYTLRQRAAQCSVAEHVERVAPSHGLKTALGFHPTAGWAVAACFTAAVSLVSVYNALLPAKPAMEPLQSPATARLVVDLSQQEEQEYLLAEDGFEVELPEEFEEFSDQLSADEIELLQAGADQYVLQLMAGSSEQDMEAFLTEHAEYDLKMYRSLADGEPWFKAVTQEFDNPNQAIAAAGELPRALRQEKPWVRSVASVQQEILQMGEVHLSEHDNSLPERWLATLGLPLMANSI